MRFIVEVMPDPFIVIKPFRIIVKRVGFNLYRAGLEHGHIHGFGSTTEEARAQVIDKMMSLYKMYKEKPDMPTGKYLTQQRAILNKLIKIKDIRDQQTELSVANVDQNMAG